MVRTRRHDTRDPPDRPAAGIRRGAARARSDGRLVVATFDPSHFERYWLNRFFPSLEAIDRARFPEPAELQAELETAGFASVRLVPLAQRGEIGREAALERVRGRFISPLQLLDDEELGAGLERMEAELPSRTSTAWSG